jgi:cobalt-zinc-cadmium efflux system outer membrane protein
MYPNPSVEILSGQARPRAGIGAAGNSTELNLQQPLEWPAAREARIQGAQFGVQSSESLRRQVINEVLTDVRLRSLEWLVRQEDIRFLKDALDLIEQTRNRIAVKVDSGEAARYELIKAEAEVLAARSRLDSSRAQAEFTRARLSQLIGIRLGENFRIASTRSAIPDQVNIDALVVRVVTNNPELKLRESELAQQEQRLTEQKVLRRPALALQARSDQDPEIRTRQVGIAVSIPVFDTRKGVIREAAADMDLAGVRLEGRRYELTQQAYATYATLLAAKRRVEALEGGVLKQAEAALSIAQAAYKFGERGILDTLDAQRVLRSVRSDLTAARLEAFSAATELDRLSGTYLDLLDPNKTTDD